MFALNHKSLGKIFLSLAGLLLGGSLFSCSDEALTDNTPSGNTEIIVPSDFNKLSIAFNISLPSTRSETEPGGGSNGHITGTDSNGDPVYDDKTENGKTNENSITEPKIDFYKADNGGWTPVTGYDYTVTLSGANTVDIEVPVDLIKDVFAGNTIRVRMTANVAAATTDDDQTISYDQILDFGYNKEKDMENQTGQTIPMANYQEFPIDFTKLNPDSEDFMQDLFSLLDSNRTINVSQGATSASDDNISIPEAGPLLLERCLARVDYKPASGLDTDGTTRLNPNVYQVGEIPNLYLKMVSVQPFNVSKGYYLYRHIMTGNGKTTKDDTDSSVGISEVLGIENSLESPGYGDIDSDLTTDTENPVLVTHYNWIEDTDWNLKGWNTITSGTFLYQSANTAGGWPGPAKDLNTTLSTVINTHYFHNQPVKGTDGCYAIQETDAKVYNVASDMAANEFTPLCYLAENTLPSTEAMIKGLSTGLVFNLILCDHDGKPITQGDISKYFMTQAVYESQMQEKVQRKAVLDAIENPSQDEIDELARVEAEIAALQKRVIGSLTAKPGSNTDYTLSVGPYTSGAATVDVKYTKGLTITITEKKEVDGVMKDVTSTVEDQAGFVVSYYYMFRHNMLKEYTLGFVGPMQFGVVRNNIYKVSVTALNSLPEPYDPTDPDEPTRNVLAIEFAILSWARVDRTAAL